MSAEALEVQAQQAELHGLIDEADGPVVECLAKRQEREQHADRKALAAQDHARAEIVTMTVDAVR